MEGKNAVAVITARRGSKRIPHKNIKEFCGRPIIEYSIEAALKSGVFDEVMVSTDDEEIAEIAKRAGAAVPFYRSKEAAGDYAATHEVILEVLEEYEKRGVTFEKAFANPLPAIAPISVTFALKISIYLSAGISSAIFCPKLFK